MHIVVFLLSTVSAFLIPVYHSLSQVQVLDSTLHHLRNQEPREWAEFPGVAESQKLVVQFSAAPNDTEQTLILRQYDVKLNWHVLLNEHPVGSLLQDEKDLITYFRIPSGVLREENILEILSPDASADDVRVGQILLDRRPLNSILTEAHLGIEVVDAETSQPLPARITITNSKGVLQTVLGSTNDPLAVRPGYVYTGNGKALLSLPAGSYRIYAGRGFEYGIDSAELVVEPGGYAYHRFSIRREVPTPGWVSSDTHIHTFTWSGHGDASASERVLTIAGEGLDLPIITDHNIHVDLKPFATDQGVEKYFTLVTGNEVTTAVGHFNVFPVSGEPVIRHRVKNWNEAGQALASTEKAKAVILNHGRDVHSGFRPFDPKKHLSSAGMRLDEWEFPANAMEVINSGAQQTDRLQLTRDWFGMLNRGHFITPAGSSDSHDVSRYIVGQARTYIRCNDEDPARINLEEAVKNFREGNVMVSFGLLAEIEVDHAYGPGEMAPASHEIIVSVKVSGPAWTRAERVMLYANGKKIREEKIEDQRSGGVKWKGDWTLTMPTHDIYLVALAEGPAGPMPFWPIGKPYQPASPDYTPGVVGLSGAVWVDADKNGKRNSAYHYATDLIADSKGDMDQLMQQLASYDEAVAIQVAAELYKHKTDLSAPDVIKALRRASPDTQSGFRIVIDELRQAQH